MKTLNEYIFLLVGKITACEEKLQGELSFPDEKQVFFTMQWSVKTVFKREANFLKETVSTLLYGRIIMRPAGSDTLCTVVEIDFVFKNSKRVVI